MLPGIMGLIPPTPPNTERDFTDSSDDSDGGLNYLVNQRRSRQMRDLSPSQCFSDRESEHSLSREHSGTNLCVLDSAREENSPVPVAKKLHNEEEIEQKYRVRSGKMDFEALERQCAQRYTTEMVKMLPSLLECCSAMEADELIQNFSSDICAGMHCSLIVCLVKLY